MTNNLPDLTKYRAIAFDLDGTLISTADLWLWAYSEYLIKMQKTPSTNFETQRQHILEKHANISGPKRYYKVFDEINKIYDINLSGKDGTEMCIEIAKQRYKDQPLKPFVFELLQKLKS